VIEKMNRLERIQIWIKTEFGFIQGNLLVLMISQTFMNFSVSLVYPFESLYISELGASPIILGLMGSISSAILAIVRIPGGFFSDRYGRRNIILAMTCGITFSYLFYAFAPSWQLIILGLIIYNVSAIGQPAVMAIQADSMTPEKRGMGYSISAFLPGILGLAAPVIAAYLIEAYGLVPGMRIGYIIVVLCYLIAALIRKRHLQETLMEPVSFEINQLVGDIKESFTTTFTVWKGLPRSVTILAFVSILGAMQSPLFNIFEVLYVRNVIGLSNIEWGFLATIFRIVQIMISIPIGKLLDKISRKSAIIPGSILLMITTLLFVYSRGFQQALLVYILFMMFGALYIPAFNALRADLIPREKRGRIMAIIGTLGSVAVVPTAALAGPFLSTIILEAIALVIIVFFIKEPEEKER
jgi:MFS family permease